MNKLILPLLTLIFFSEITFGQKVEKNDAEKIAKEIYRRNNKGEATNLKNVIPLGDEKEKDTLLYIVPFEKSGFAIISGQFAAPPALGFCFKGDYDPDSIPPGLLYLIEKYKYEISELKKEKKKPVEKVEKLWKEYLDENQLKSYTVGTHLLNTEWGQSSNFNQFCPSDCPAGCTAVAMAQIIRYWECRIDPTGYVSYSGSGYYGGSANIGATTYYWQDMNNTTADADNALLIYHAGVSCLTHYNTDGSSSTPGRARDGFVNNWGINSSADVRWRISHLSTWEGDLKDELDLERPVLYSGSALLGGGHSWVLEGYNSQNQFYCNWGWNGSDNGWYSLGNFDPPGDLGPYNQYESAIFNVYPFLPTGVGTPYLSNKVFTYNINGYSLTIPEVYGATSYEWTTSSGTISGSGTNVTLYSDQSTVVNIRAYNDVCGIYSPYETSIITIEYGPISAPDIICYSGSTIAIQNVPSNTNVTWGGTNVSYPNGNTGTSVTIRAANSSTANEGTITASFTIGSAPYAISKKIWVGAPKINNITGPTSTPNGQWATYHAVLDNELSGATDYNWILNPLNGNSVYDYGDDVDIAFYNSGSYQLLVQALNTCSSPNFGPYYGTSLYVYDSKSLSITPNPSNGEVTISIESTNEKGFVAEEEWEMAIYDQSQLLKEKKTSLRGKSTKIQTFGWKEGVYMVRVKYKDEILTGKLVVKK